MKPHLVADVGNSRIKWGICDAYGMITSASLPPDDPDAWQQQLAAWMPRYPGPFTWAIAGVHPERCDRLAEWIRQRGDSVKILGSWRQLPLEVKVEQPERVGIDRLLNTVALRSRTVRAVSMVIIDAGSAVTVDWVDEQGTFRGGAIFPGLRLMAKALHEYTAALPEVAVREPSPAVPGTSTAAAIEAGIYWATAGGIKALVRQLAYQAADGRHGEVYLTGGDAELLAPVMDLGVHVWPRMTLEGIRIAAQALP
jgi:type III pantothenate kinase